MRPSINFFMAVAAAALFLTACGDTTPDTSPSEAESVTAGAEDATPAETEDVTTADPSEAEEQAKEQAQKAGDEMVEELEEQQGAEGGGHATFTAGDETWEFDAVVCTFGADEADEDIAEFTLSSIQDGLQLHLMIYSEGHLMSLNDVTDFENPSVSLSTDMFNNTDEFLVVDGKDVTGETVVFDGDDASLTEIPATVEATCP